MKREVVRASDLVLRVDCGTWCDGKYDAFLDSLCGTRGYQRDAILVAMQYLWGGAHDSQRALVRYNWLRNEALRERYGAEARLVARLPFPEKIAATIDLATGTGKSYAIFGVAALSLAEGLVDQVVVLCPSVTIERQLINTLSHLAAVEGIVELLPDDASHTPEIIGGDESVRPGCVVIENYHQVLDFRTSSIRDSLPGKGGRTLIINDECHHVVNGGKSTKGRWKEFVDDAEFGFKYVLGFSGTCYLKDDYFPDVIYRYSLRDAIEEGVVKDVEYVADMEEGLSLAERWQLVHARHKDIAARVSVWGLVPLTLIVTGSIRRCDEVADELALHIAGFEGLTQEEARGKVLSVHSKSSELARLEGIEEDDEVEWLVSVSMLTEGWDVHRVFQIVPHEERAFNSKLLISQVLGRGLRIPRGVTEQPSVSVFNHAAWAARIRHLVDEILEQDQKIVLRMNGDSEWDFLLHTIAYMHEPVETKHEAGEYRLFRKGFVDLANDPREQRVSVTYERAGAAETHVWDGVVVHETYSVDELAHEMYGRLEVADEGAGGYYTQTYPVDKLRGIIVESLERIDADVITDRMRQRFLASLGTLHREETTVVRYRRSVDGRLTFDASSRAVRTVSASELSSNKVLFYTEGARESLSDREKALFDRLSEEGSGYRLISVVPDRWRTPAWFALADTEAEKRFVQGLLKLSTTGSYRAWVKGGVNRFYDIEYAWRRGTHAKRGVFSPDFLLATPDLNVAIEVRSKEELDALSPETIRKYQFARTHFQHMAEEESDWPRYRSIFLTAASFPAFFDSMERGALAKYTSELELRIKESSD